MAEVAILPASEAPIIHLILIRNPLAPSASREHRALAFDPGKTLADYMSLAFEHASAFVVSLNGVIVPMSAWQSHTPRPGDYIVAAPAVLGGGVWRTLAEVGVMAAAIGVSLLLFPAGAIIGGIVASAISVGGNMLISALMPMQSSAKAQTPSYAFQGPSSLAQSGTVIPKGYGTFQWGGNIISSFVDVEGEDQYINALVCFGFGPARSITNIQINGKDIGSYNSGAISGGVGNVQQYLRYGTNTQPAIEAFNRVVNGYPQEVQVTCAGGPVVVPGTGTLTQALQVDIEFPTGVFYITGDGNQVPCTVVYKVEYAVSGTGAWQAVLQPNQTQDVIIYHSDGTVNTSATPTWGLYWTGGAPGTGIVLATDNGPHTPGDQQTVTQTITTYEADGSHSSTSQSFNGEWQPINTSLYTVEVLSWMNGWVEYQNSDTQVVYNRTSIYGLAPNKYDVRVTKYGSNNSSNTIEPGDFDSPHRGQEVWIHSVNEITYQDLSYPNMILIGVRALATNQLSGANINITALIEHGLRTLDNNLLPAALQAYEEDNPACVAADMMLDPLYGGGQYPGITPANIERFIDEWIDWAELNDTLVPDGNGNSIRLHVFNGIFDNEDNLWNQLLAVGRMSRAAIIPVGLDYGVFVDEVRTPVQMFTMGNIVRDSYQETWMQLDARANQIEVQFADSTRYYKQDNPIVYMDPTDLANGVEVKNVRIDGKGITLPAQAWHLGHFKGVCNKLLLRTGQFKADTDSIACRAGNAIILQHDVPQWGWGGRTLQNSTASVVKLDRSDIPWDGTTAYNIVCLFPSTQRYSGSVTSVASDVDSSGLTIGISLGLSSFDNMNRVTRCVINGTDYPILSASPSAVVVESVPGSTPIVGQAYVLYDTDVMETATVSGVANNGDGTCTATLGTPFTQAPADFSVYFYGQPGSQKIVAVAAIRRASEFRSTIEWIDYDPNCYTIGTPVVGETSAQNTTSPGVTGLQAKEIFDLDPSTGSYIDYVSLTWKNGANTAGVGIYGTFNGTSLKLLDRLTGINTSWQMQVAPNVTWTFVVVGFDDNNVYAPLGTAPSVTFTAVGIAKNLLKGSTFQSGFAYWNVMPRAGDTLAPDFSNDGEAIYTVAGSALTAPIVFLTQVVPPSLWSIGTLLMLSAYLQTTGAPSGEFGVAVSFQDGTGADLGTTWATLAMSGSAMTLTRINTGVLTVPSGTVTVLVEIGFRSSLSLPVASTFDVNHLLLEVAESGQTVPSAWADIDAKGNVLDIFQLGSSAGLRTQASTVPTFTGGFTYASASTTLTISWTNLVILWPDGGLTYVQDGTIAITGLSASTVYYAYLYFDVINGGIAASTPTTAVGTPAILTTSQDASADAACKQDGRVALTPGGMSLSTVASGGSGGGTGGGGLPGGHHPTY